jgi:hypothetical protein
LFYNFCFKGSKRKLNDLCKKWFNSLSDNNTQVTPQSNQVIVSFACNPKVYSDHIDYREKGYTTYNELIFFFFVTLTQDHAEPETYAVIPYLFSDNCSSIVVGREVYGIPKAQGWINIPEVYNEKNKLSAEILSIQKYAKNSPLDRNPFVEIIAKGNIISEENEIKIENLVNNIQEILFRNNPITFSFLSLKQFREIADASEACYQDIVKFHCKRDHYKIDILSGDFELNFTHSDMFPVYEDLGLNIKGNMAIWASKVNIDYTFGIEKSI